MSFKRMADMINAAAGGSLVVEIFPGGALVPETEELDAVHRGVADATTTSHGYQVKLFPQAGLFHQVCGGLTPVQAQMWYILGGGNELAARVYEPLDVVYVGTPMCSSPEVWAHSTVRLETMADIKGLKMRAIGETGEVMAKFGVAAVIMPGGEVYEATARGVIDAFEYAGANMDWTMGFHEVAEYLYLSPTRAPTTAYGFWVNEDSWAELTPDLQEIVSMAPRVEIQNYYAETVVLDYEALANYIDYGTKVLNLPKEIEEELLKAAKEHYDEKAAADPLYSEIVASQRTFKEICELQSVR